MAGLLPLGFLTFWDANGDPLAGGSVGYYESNSPGTLKAIWGDPGQTVQLQNPIPLDAAGRPFTGGSEVGIWGTGQYTMIVNNAGGALQWSAITIQPLELSDLTNLENQLAAETAARIAADQAEANARVAADNAEATARANGDTNLQNQINTINGEIQALKDAIAAAQKPPTIQHGINTTDATGHTRVSFATPYSGTPSVVAVENGATFDLLSATINADLGGFDLYLAFPLPGVGIQPAGARGFYWIASGPQ